MFFDVVTFVRCTSSHTNYILIAEKITLDYLTIITVIYYEYFTKSSAAKSYYFSQKFVCIKRYERIQIAFAA